MARRATHKGLASSFSDWSAMTDDEMSRHDVRNQLSIIYGYAESLLDDVEAGDPRRRDLEEIHKAALAALELLARAYPAHAHTPR